MSRHCNTAVSLVLALVLAGSLAACGSTNATSAQPMQNEAVEAKDLLNASFEEGMEHWVLSEDSTPEATYLVKDSHSGKSALSCWAMEPYRSHVSQTLKGIEPGYYTLTAYTQCSGNQDCAYLYANGSGQGACKSALPTTNDLNCLDDGWNKVTVRGIQVGEDGLLTVGLFTDAQKRDLIVLDDLALTKEETAARPFLMGGDISQLTYVEDCGAVFYDAEGNPADALQVLAESGWNFARLRLYNDPGPGHGDETNYCHEDYLDPEDVLRLARRAKEKGMTLQLSLHYSDYWTNGSTQIIPFAWQEQIAGLSDAAAVDRLEELVYDFTKDFMQQMAAQGTTPEYVSIGNEVQAGMLFPYGKTSVETWPNLARFFNAGYKAVKEVSPDTQVIIHLDAAGDLEQYEIFFDDAQKYGVNYDIVGGSYYPFYEKMSTGDILAFTDFVVERYDKDVMLMETGFNWNEKLPNGWGGQLADNGCYDGIYESTPEGQKAFLVDLFSTVQNATDGRCLGDLYWDPIFVEQEGVGWAYYEGWDTVANNIVSNTTLFDYDHAPLPILDAYAQFAVDPQTARLAGKLVGDDLQTPISHRAITVTVGSESYQTVTDAAGGFFLHLPACEQTPVSVQVEGLDAAADPVLLTVSKGELAKETFAVNGGNIAGTITDDLGNPVSTAQVLFESEDYRYTTMTDASGQYLAADLPAGNYVVSAQADGYYVATAPFGVSLAIGDAVTGQDFDFYLTSGTITGMVCDKDGKPLSGATVSAWKDLPNADEDADFGVIRVTTDESGCYTLPFVPADTNYKVEAYLYTYDASTTDVRIPRNQTTELPAFTLVQALGSVSGSIVDAAGAGVGNAAITITAEDGLTYEGVSDANGAFTLTDVLVGNYTLFVEKTGYMSGSAHDIAVSLNQQTAVGAVVMPTPVEILNPGFEEPGAADGDMLGWTVDCTVSGSKGPACFRQNRDKFGGTIEGSYALSIWLDTNFYADAQQTIQDLPAGRYVLQAMTYSGISGEFTMYVKDGSGEIIAETPIPKSGGYISTGLEFETTGGTITIGFATDTAGSDWAVVDRVELGTY